VTCAEVASNAEGVSSNQTRVAMSGSPLAWRRAKQVFTTKSRMSKCLIHIQLELLELFLQMEFSVRCLLRNLLVS
jgi:hypothetical protein